MVKFSRRDLEALIDALIAWEKIKPGQVGKRIVFERYGIRGTVKDRILTAVIYNLERRRGLIDKIITSVNIDVNNLDPCTKALARLIVYERLFGKGVSRLYKSLVKRGIDAVENLCGPSTRGNAMMIVNRLENISYRSLAEINELELRYSAPSELIEDVIKVLGPEETSNFFKATEELKYLSFRVNTLKTSVEEVVEKLSEEGYGVERSKLVPTVIRVKGPFNYVESKAFRDGLIIPQDDAGALASILLDPRPGELVVDMCAAPGGKTTHLAELMKNKGRILAIEIFEDRARRLRQRVEKAGASIVQIYLMDGRNAPEAFGENIADRVLLDPPCSNTGTLTKSPDARWRFTRSSIESLMTTQRELMESAIKLLRKGGVLLYTTCSVLREENEDNVMWLLSKYSGCLRLSELKYPGLSYGLIPGTLRTWPHIHGTAGFFYACFEKTC